MSKKNVYLTNQIILPFMRPFDPVGRKRISADAGPGATHQIRLADCGQDDGNGRPLARANASSVAGLRDEGRETWFLPVDFDPPDPAA